MGIFSRMALELGAEQVVCFEPSPQTAHCLERTFAAEIEAKRMILVKKAVWDKLETLQLSAAS
jgi:FkbM family methyltransferase